MSIGRKKRLTGFLPEWLQTDDSYVAVFDDGGQLMACIA